MKTPLLKALPLALAAVLASPSLFAQAPEDTDIHTVDLVEE